MTIILNECFTTKWVKLADIPATPSYRKVGNNESKVFWQQLTNSIFHGIYQVSLNRPRDLIHKDICYIGSSGFLPKRLNDLRVSATNGNLSTHHTCGAYIREEGIELFDVYVRCIIPNGEIDEVASYVHNVESQLQDLHKKKYGYKVGYAWEEASGGYKNARIQTQVAIKRLESLEACRKVQQTLNEQIAKLSKKV